jgi:hypothetical protein
MAVGKACPARLSGAPSRPRPWRGASLARYDLTKDIMAADANEEGPGSAGVENPRRRDFLNIAAVSFAGVGGAA